MEFFLGFPWEFFFRNSSRILWRDFFYDFSRKAFQDSSTWGFHLIRCVQELFLIFLLKLLLGLLPEFSLRFFQHFFFWDWPEVSYAIPQWVSSIIPLEGPSGTPQGVYSENPPFDDSFSCDLLRSSFWNFFRSFLKNSFKSSFHKKIFLVVFRSSWRNRRKNYLVHLRKNSWINLRMNSLIPERIPGGILEPLEELQKKKFRKILEGISGEIPGTSLGSAEETPGKISKLAPWELLQRNPGEISGQIPGGILKLLQISREQSQKESLEVSQK